MKQIIITITFISMCFGGNNIANLLQSHILFDDVYPQDEGNIDLPEGEKISHFSNSTRTDRTPWEEVSPINGAAINEITVSISDPNIVYATTYGNGVFKSTDAGNTWSPTALINEIGTNDGLAISPIDPNIVFASAYGFGHYTGGVFKTIDGGETWTTIEYFGNTYVRGIFIDPSNPQTIFTYRGQTNYYGYEYSTDGGETWAYNDLYNIDSSSISIYGFHGDPEDSSVVFAHGSRGKVIRILDNGSTGTIEHDVSEFAYYLGSMDISESNPDHIYLGTSNGFLFTLDGGNSWTLLDEEFGYDPDNDDYTIPNSTAVYDVVVHPENDNEVWFQSSDFGPFRSLDGGFTIESMMPPIMDTWGYELAFSSTDGHILFGPWWKGLWRFDGESWLESSEGLKHQFIRDLFITEDMEIWSGNLRHAVSKSNDNGITWAHYNSGMESWYNTAMSVDPSGEHALANTYAGPYMTSNSGSDWTNTHDQLDYRMGFYRSNAEPNTVYVAGYESMDSYYGTTTNWKIMRSENQGQDWDTSLEFYDPEDYRIYEMGIDHGDANNLIAIVRYYSGNGSSDDVEYTTWFSDDGGENWNSDNININDFPSSGMRSFIRINSEWFCTTWGDGFYKYTNGGWEQTGNGLPENAYLGQMLYNPLPDNALYVGTWGAGVYVSYDLGETFEPMNDGLTNLGVLSIGSGITDEGLVTMVGTYGGNYKIVQSSAPEISIDPDTLDFGLVYIGYPDTLDLTIFNEGLSALTVESIDVDGDGFSLASGQNFPMEVFALEPLNVPVVFGGDTQGTYAGTLTITSNDSDETPLIVNLYGDLAGPPIISVSPDSLYSALFTGETDTQTLQLANNGSSDLYFSINLLNVNTRPHINIEPGNGPTLSIQDVQGFWNLDHEYSSSGSGRPGVTTVTRTTRSWQLLANDPQDNNSPYDTENIYYEVTDTSLNFKYEYYEPWDEAEENTVAIVFLNIDNDTETGETIEGYYNGYELLWEGIDALIYSFGSDYFDGIYIYDADYYGYGEFVFYEPLAWRIAEDNTNKFSFAVSNELFQGLTSSRIASWSGSFDYEQDIVPNEGMLDLYFRPAWLSIEPLDSVITVGSSLDLSVTFDATGLFGGDYHALIQVNSNDPATPELNVPAHLNVTGIPLIDYPEQADFGQVFVGYPDTLAYTISNIGTDVLLVNNFQIQDDRVGTLEAELSIPPLEEMDLHLVINMNTVEDLLTYLSFESNDDSHATVEGIPIMASGVLPPIINVSPSEFVFSHNTQNMETTEMIISNTGGSDLSWYMEFDLTGGAGEWIFFEKGNYADPSFEENQDRITDYIWLTRDDNGPLFNFINEEGPEYGCDSQTPTGTQWSPYPKEYSDDDDYSTFINMTGCCPPCIVGDSVSVWLIEDDIRLNVVFSSWASGGDGGGFSYFREAATPHWISGAPTSGTIQSTSEQSVLLSVNSEELESGEYATIMVINSNDPGNPMVFVPVNPITAIRFDIPVETYRNTSLRIYDITGRMVETLVNEKLEPGQHEIQWNASQHSSGVYFLRMNAVSFTKTQKMILLK